MLSNEESGRLIELEKKAVDKGPFDFPNSGESIEVDLQSMDGREEFKLDVSRKGRIQKLKCTYQNRYQRVIILVRVDIGGPPHQNPDGTDVSHNHIHIYKEGYDDKWAYELPEGFTDDSSDLLCVLEGFYRYCNIVEKPQIRMQESLGL